MRGSEGDDCSLTLALIWQDGSIRSQLDSSGRAQAGRRESLVRTGDGDGDWDWDWDWD